MKGWALATMGISIALGASTISELKHGWENHKKGGKGMSVVYLWLRSLLFVSLAVVLFLNPSRTGDTVILALLSVWYVIFYGILLVLHYKTPGTPEEEAGPP